MALLSIKALSVAAEEALVTLLNSKAPKTAMMGVTVPRRWMDGSTLFMSFSFNRLYVRFVTEAHLHIAADAMMNELGVSKGEYDVKVDLNG